MFLNSSTLGPPSFINFLCPYMYVKTRRAIVVWFDVANLIIASISGELKKYNCNKPLILRKITHIVATSL